MKFNKTGVSPWFLMYIVRWIEFPISIVPHSMREVSRVHSGLEYTAMSILGSGGGGTGDGGGDG